MNEKFYFSNQKFQICWLISHKEVKNIQNFSSVSLKIKPARPKSTGTWVVNMATTNLHNLSEHTLDIILTITCFIGMVLSYQHKIFYYFDIPFPY